MRALGVRDYEAFYRRSVEDPEDFGAEQARKIYWNRDRSIQAIAEGGDPGEVPTIEDPSALDGIKSVSAAQKR